METPIIIKVLTLLMLTIGSYAVGYMHGNNS